jgi:hypothetical protein
MKYRRLALIASVAALSTGALVGALPAHATTVPTAVDITRRCTKTSVGNLQLQREDTGQISVDFGVDMARHTSGVAWRVRETRNGVLFVNTTARTIADGSFSISKLLAPNAVNHIVATATNPATGEICSIGAYVQ